MDGMFQSDSLSQLLYCYIDYFTSILGNYSAAYEHSKTKTKLNDWLYLENFK